MSSSYNIDVGTLLNDPTAHQEGKDILSRPPGAEHTDTGLHGPAPAGYPENCFWHVDDPLHNSEMWFYLRVAQFVDIIYDIGADTTIYKGFSGQVHYFEPISTSNIFEAEQEIKKGNNVLKNRESHFNNYGLSNITNDKRQITWEAGDVRPNPEGEDIILGDDTFMKTMRGDEYMEKHNHDKVGFISIDVEGHELEVLQGFGDRLKDVGFVQLEHGGTTYSAGHKLSEIINYLSEHGFWGFCYLDMYERQYNDTSNLIGSMTPLHWNENSEDHYAYCNIVCVNKNILQPHQTLYREIVDHTSHTKYENEIVKRLLALTWPE